MQKYKKCKKCPHQKSVLVGGDHKKIFLDYQFAA